MSPSPGAAVELRGVRHEYRDDAGAPPVAAVDGIDLEVPAGELVAVVGPSGSGKSTLLHLMGALARPTAGTVRIGGVDLGHAGPAELAALRNRTVGFVFQQFNLVAHLSAAANVALPAVIAGRRPRDYEATVRDLLAHVGLADKADRLPARLSGGEQQRLAVARALVNDPALVLADEPTGNLDSRAGAAIVGLLHAAHRAGRTVVLVTHDLRLASQAERVVHLRDGRITHETAPSGRPGEGALEGLLRTGEAPGAAP